MTQITDTIMRHVDWMHLYVKGFQFVQITNDTLRVQKGSKSLDIRYDFKLDLYEVNKHTVRPDLTIITERIESAFCDELENIVAEFFKEEVRL